MFFPSNFFGLLHLWKSKSKSYYWFYRIQLLNHDVEMYTLYVHLELHTAQYVLQSIKNAIQTHYICHVVAASLLSSIALLFYFLKVKCTSTALFRISADTVSHTVFIYFFTFFVNEYYEFGQTHFTFCLLFSSKIYTFGGTESLWNYTVALLLLFAYKNWFIIICILWSWLIVESDCERMDRKRHQWPEWLKWSGQSDN